MLPEITPALRQDIRSRFPALASGPAYLENAGGSQVPACVADRIRDYMLGSYVQLGAGYELSQRCTELVDRAHDFVRLFAGAAPDAHAILGPSTTVLLNLLGRCYGDILEPGAEIIVAETAHEANLTPWKMLERKGVVLRWWRMDPQTCECPLDDLEALLNERTALVAFPHVSNLLGEIVDVAEITRRVHAAGARVVVDGVAFAPHRLMDCADWQVDWYVYSTYKVYGPHMAALIGTAEALSDLPRPNHFFIPDDELPYQFEPGGACHEGCAGLLGLAEHLAFLAGIDGPKSLDRAALTRAFDMMTACELPLQQRLVDYLLGKDGVRIIGPGHGGPARVGTVSFVHDTLTSSEITAAVDASGDVAIRHGHMYAWHLCERLGLDPDDGVVRTSLVHYNMIEEIERLIEIFETVLP